MQGLFPGYYKPTTEEFSRMWQECVFVFDANMLLNIYRYSPATRHELFAILERLKDRIWLPHQVMLEYHENREEVIAQQYNVVAEVEAALRDASDEIEAKYKRGHPFADTKFIATIINEAIEKINASIVEAQAKFPNLRESDYLLNTITRLFNNRVGSKYPPKRLEAIYQELDLRYKLQIPPGYRDKNLKREGFKKYGDGVLWFQLIDYAKAQKKPIILTTDDQKEDWWRIEKGKTLGPRPELIEEIRSKAGVAFYMYNASQFLIYAKEFLGLSVQQKAIDEVTDVQQDSARLYLGYVVENAVQNWLESKYPQSQLTREYRENQLAPRLDFRLIESNGTRIGIEVRYFSHLHYVNTVVKQVLGTIGSVQNLDKIIIFIVTSDVLNVTRILDILENKIVIPENVSIIIGHMGPDNQFFYDATLPNEP